MFQRFLVLSLIRALLLLCLITGMFCLSSELATAEASPSTNSGLKTIDSLPFPNVPKVEKILGPAGEIFDFATCNRGELGFTLANAQIPPGAGPLPHIHHYTNEWFWTPEGGLELFQSVSEYADLEHPALGTDRAKIYTVDTQPNQIIYGPKYRVHGFANVTDQTRPLTFIWIRDDSSPAYSFNDGGIREYFQDVGIPIKNSKKLPAITDQAKQEFVTHASQYGINQSYYFFEYVSEVSQKPPDILAKTNNDQDLARIIEAIDAYNQGDSSVSCF